MSNNNFKSDYFLGIDVSKDDLVIYNPLNNRTYKVKNSQKSIRTFIAKITSFGINRMALKQQVGMIT